MAWALGVGAARRCALLGAASPTSPATQHLRPSRAPTTWPWRASTSRATTTAGTNRVLGSSALLSTWRKTTTRGAAVTAGVEVVVVDAPEHGVDDCDGGSADPVVDHLYGSVTAQSRAAASGDRWVKEKEECTLFHRAKGQLARVARGTAVPLHTATTLVPAPPFSELRVSAELLDASASWQNPDQEIAGGSAVFAPRLAGTDTAEITGADGKVRVDVTWSS